MEIKPDQARSKAIKTYNQENHRLQKQNI